MPDFPTKLGTLGSRFGGVAAHLLALVLAPIFRKLDRFFRPPVQTPLLLL